MLCQLSLAGMFGLFVVLGCVGVRSVGFCFRRFRFFFGLCGGFFVGCFRLLRDWRRVHATFLLISAFAGVFRRFFGLFVFFRHVRRFRFFRYFWCFRRVLRFLLVQLLRRILVFVAFFVLFMMSAISAVSFLGVGLGGGGALVVSIAMGLAAAYFMLCQLFLVAYVAISAWSAVAALAAAFCGFGMFGGLFVFRIYGFFGFFWRAAFAAVVVFSAYAVVAAFTAFVACLVVSAFAAFSAFCCVFGAVRVFGVSGVGAFFRTMSTQHCLVKQTPLNLEWNLDLHFEYILNNLPPFFFGIV